MPSIRFSGFTTNWEQLKLRDISKKIGSGKTPRGGRTVYTDVGIRLLRSQNIYGDRVNFGDVVYITQKMDLEMSNSRVEKNDVLLNITGASIGRTAVYELSNHSNVNQHVCIIRPKNNVNSDFVQLNLSSYKGQKQIELNQAGGGREGLNFQQIAKMNFYFPTFQEQSKIGLLFKQVDNTITLQQQLLTDYNQLKKTLLQQLFPQKEEKVPKVRFAGFRDYWEEKTLGKISNMYQPTTIGKNDLLGSGIPVFGANGYIGYYSIENHNSSQVTISARGENAGNPSYVKGPVWITGNSMVINIDENPEIDKYFLYQSLLSSSLKKFVTGGAQPQLTRNILDKVPIKKPSFKEQEKIGQFFKQLDETIEGHEQKLATYQELKKALLQRMFV